MKRIITRSIACIMAMGAFSTSVLAYVTEMQKLIASDGEAWDYFGEDVALSGDYAIIAANADDDNGNGAGAVHMYERINGVFTNVAKLTASDGYEGERFGLSASLSGGYAIVGAPWSVRGSAYIIERIDGVWSEVAKLEASDGAYYDQFGLHTSIDGNTAVVAAYRNHGGSHLPPDGGGPRAYVYERIGGLWTDMATLAPSDAVSSFAMAVPSVSVSSNRVAMGYCYDDDKGYMSGSVYVYERVDGVWMETAKLTANDGAPEDLFGRSISIWGDYLIVGAYADDDKAGAAYVFECIDGSWTQVAKLTASAGDAGDMFGVRVSIFDNNAIVTAIGEVNYPKRGSVYVYERINGVWLNKTKLIARGARQGVQLGAGLSVCRDYALAGCSLDYGQTNYTGAAYLFYLNLDRAPIANAGGPYVEDATSWDGAMIALDGLDSHDPDGEPLTYEWDLDLAIDSGGDGNLANDVDETEASTTLWQFPIGQVDIALVVRNALGLPSEPDITSVTVSYINVDVDVRPGEDSNIINMNSHGIIPVAFLTDESFDATTINPLTITLRGEDFSDGLVKLRGKKEAPLTLLEDVDGDGDLDLLVKLDAEKLNAYELEALCVLGALTYDGYVVSGSDTIRIVPAQ